MASKTIRRSNWLILVLALLVAALLILLFWLSRSTHSRSTPTQTQTPPQTTAQSQVQTSQATVKHSLAAPTQVQATKQTESEESETPMQEQNTPAGWPTVTANDGRNNLGLPYTREGIVLVNRLHPVNWDYIPQIASREGVYLAPEALKAYFTMREAARAEGIDFFYRSGYRDFATQVAIRQQYLNTDPGGEEAVDRYSAPAGASEHQTGLAVDIDNGEGLSYDFAETPAGAWLHQHAYEFGFILRFPDGKEGITGYLYEPWHFRYVGPEVARAFGPHNQLTLEEYLDDEPAPAPYYHKNP